MSLIPLEFSTTALIKSEYWNAHQATVFDTYPYTTQELDSRKDWAQKTRQKTQKYQTGLALTSVFMFQKALKHMCRRNPLSHLSKNACSLPHKHVANLRTRQQKTRLPKAACLYIECTVRVVYRIPLDCSEEYIGQTGRCVNGCAREHDLLLKREMGPTCQPTVVAADALHYFRRSRLQAEAVTRLRAN